MLMCCPRLQNLDWHLSSINPILKMARSQRPREGRRHRPDKWVRREGGPGNPGGGRQTRGGSRVKGKSKGTDMEKAKAQDKSKSKGTDMEKGKPKDKSKGKGQGKSDNSKDNQCFEKATSNML